MFTLTRSPEMKEINIDLGLFEKRTKHSDIDFIGLYNYYTTHHTNLRELSKKTGVPATRLSEIFKKVRRIKR